MGDSGVFCLPVPLSLSHSLTISNGYLSSNSYIQTPSNKSEEGWLSLVTLSSLFFPKDTKPFHFTFH